MSVAAWLDKQGDVWTLGADGLMHTPETAPFSREHVEKKWGPLVALTPAPDVDEPCKAEICSWDIFRHQQVDRYWMRCHRVGEHVEHENSETGATWPVKQEGEPS